METYTYILLGSLTLSSFMASTQIKINETTKSEHKMINVDEKSQRADHSLHPDAQRYPE